VLIRSKYIPEDKLVTSNVVFLLFNLNDLDKRDFPNIEKRVISILSIDVSLVIIFNTLLSIIGFG
jgi:hypothetical protein